MSAEAIRHREIILRTDYIDQNICNNTHMYAHNVVEHTHNTFLTTMSVVFPTMHNVKQYQGEYILNYTQ